MGKLIRRAICYFKGHRMVAVRFHQFSEGRAWAVTMCLRCRKENGRFLLD